MIDSTTCGLNQNTQKKIINVFESSSLILRAILYGSRAIGRFKNSSDIDLTLDAPNMKLEEMFAVENEIDDLLLPYQVDLSLLHLLDNQPLKSHIARCGIEFYSALTAKPALTQR